MNVALLKQVAAQVSAAPRQLDMTTFDCGTAACIAGWAARLSGQSLPAHDEEMGSNGDSFRRGKELLRLDGGQAVRLFYLDWWPDRFAEPYLEAACLGRHQKKAAATVARIDHFIATGGRE